VYGIRVSVTPRIRAIATVSASEISRLFIRHVGHGDGCEHGFGLEASERRETGDKTEHAPGVPLAAMRRLSVEPWIHALVAGGTAGVLAEVMVMRLNPEVTQSAVAALTAIPLWLSWGVVMGGIPLLLVVPLVRRWPRPVGDWPAPELTALVFVIAAVMSWINADLHREYLTATGHRILRQDVAVWSGGVLLALAGGAAVRRFGTTLGLRVAFAGVMLALPTMRLVWQPIPQNVPEEIVARPLGSQERPLLVVGIEGFDSKVLLVHAAGDRYRNLDLLQESGAWGPLTPHQPYLRQSLWTTLTTGTYPGRHGVKSSRAWRLPWLENEPLRLLPWTPQGSRLILPWGVADQVVPPPSSVPPLWERLRASGVSTEVFGWPGFWGPQVTVVDVVPRSAAVDPDGAVQGLLEEGLEPFDDQREEIVRAVERDELRIEAAVRALSAGTRDVWVFLEGLSIVRRELEPLKPLHTGERELMERVIEVLDIQLGRLLAASSPETLVAVVSPYGLAPPSSYERLRRTLGFGGSWRTSAEECPEGALLLRGHGVPRGRRIAATQLVDVAPTLCYLLGLPVAQYMEGGVVIDGVGQEYLASHPLRVVD
jgi:hypothetical protein